MTWFLFLTPGDIDDVIEILVVAVLETEFAELADTATLARRFILVFFFIFVLSLGLCLLLFPIPVLVLFLFL